MAKEVHPEQITSMKKELDRIDKTMTEGFSSIKAEMKILNRNYVSRDDLDKTVTKLCDKMEKNIGELQNNKADKWVQSVVAGTIYVAGGAVILALMGSIIVQSI